MKKLIAALLVLTMVLALTGTAMAGCKYKEGDWIKFTKNATAYKTKGGKATSTIVKKGSVAYVVCDQKYDKWVKVGLEWYPDEDGKVIYRWFKTADLKADPGFKLDDDDPILLTYWYDDEDEVWHNFHVVYSQGGNGLSSVGPYYDEEEDKIVDAIFEADPPKSCYITREATAKVWLHKEPSLKKSYGKALRKGDRVAYKGWVAYDTRGTVFYKVKYKGNCNLWVSEAYTKWSKKKATK